MRPTREVYDRFKAELTDIQPGVEMRNLPGEESLIGTHPVYGLVSAARLAGTAANPHRTSHTIIIMTDDENLAARARLVLDTDEFP